MTRKREAGKLGPRLRRWVRRALALLVGLLVVGVLARDVVLRHLACWVLARTFEGTAEVGTAHVDSLRRFTFTELTIRTGGSLPLTLSADSVTCHAARSLALDGKLRSVLLEGADLTLDVRSLGSRPLPAWLAPQESFLGTLTCRGSSVRVLTPLGEVEVDLPELVFGPRPEVVAESTPFRALLTRARLRRPDGKPLLEGFSCRADGSWHSGRQALTLSLTGVPLRAFLPALRGILGEVQLAGDAAVEVEARGPYESGRVTLTVLLAEVTGSLPDLQAEWEGLRGSLGLSGERSGGDEVLRGDLRIDAGAGLLHGGYLEFDDHRLTLALHLSRQAEQKQVTLEELTARLRGLAELEASAEVTRGEAPRAQLTADLYLPALAEVSELVSSALEERSTALAGLRLGGQLEVVCQVEAEPARTEWSGRLGWSSGSLELGPVRLRRALLRLPFRIVRGEGRTLEPSAEEQPPYGLLVTEGLSLGGVRAGLSPVLLRLAGEELQFRDEQRLALMDGEVVVRDLLVRRLWPSTRSIRLRVRDEAASAESLAQATLSHVEGWSGQPEVTGAVDVEQLSLAQLTGDAPVQFAGECSGHFPGLLVTGDDFRTEGAATLELFGGTVTVTELQGQDLSRPWWRLGFSAEAEHLDLSQVTAAFDWGRASGLVSGAVRGMVLSAGEPEAFEVELRSEPAAGVRQTLEVAVLEKIPVLRSAAPFLRALKLEELSYDAMGLWCRLENDRLWVRGTARELLSERGEIPIPLLGPLLGVIGEALESPIPEGELFIVGRWGLRPLNVVFEPVPEGGADWPRIWEGLRTGLQEGPKIDVR